MLVDELTNSIGDVFCRVEYDEENKWGYNAWYGYVSFEDIKAGSFAILEAARNYRYDRAINDSRYSEGGMTEATEWLATEIIPQMIQAGVRYSATVLGSDVFSRLSAEELEGQIQSVGFSYRNFDNIEEARHWLRSQP